MTGVQTCALPIFDAERTQRYAQSLLKRSESITDECTTEIAEQIIIGFKDDRCVADRCCDQYKDESGQRETGFFRLV